MANAVQFIPLTNINSAAILPAYAPINVGGLPHACSAIRIINDSTIDIFVSFDGVTDHEFMQSGETLYMPFQISAQPNGWMSLLSAHTQVFVRAPAPGVGLIMLSGYYTKD
jgi:hypothetical protein